VATLRIYELELKYPEDGKERFIRGGPLFDLVELQRMLATGELDLGDDDQVDVATTSCWEDLKKLQWTTRDDVRNLLGVLKPGKRAQGGDFINSQWCKDDDGDLHPCDSYRVRVDHKTWQRNPKAPLYYVKFSLNEEGTLYLVLISCHLDKPQV